MAQNAKREMLQTQKNEEMTMVTALQCCADDLFFGYEKLKKTKFPTKISDFV